MLVVAGLSLRNLEPRVWDPSSPYYLPALQAVMISYADFCIHPYRRRHAMDKGLHEALNIPQTVQIYLDNGAFYFLRRQQAMPVADYEEFVRESQPGWYPIPRDYIPTPAMTAKDKASCFRRTMKVNRAYHHNDFVPVIHIGDHLPQYTRAIRAHRELKQKPHIALGGIVPNLLRTPKAMPHQDIITSLQNMRASFGQKSLHVFGIGGTATIHIAALLNLNSIDSTGWRNRAARGIIQLPGRGDRMVSNLGNWRGRTLNQDERKILQTCSCPACQAHGIEGLEASKLAGFCNRATHNLWVLLEEARAVQHQLAKDTYAHWYQDHVSNSTYRPLIDRLVDARG